MLTNIATWRIVSLNNLTLSLRRDCLESSRFAVMTIEPNRVYTFDEVLKLLQLSPVTLRKLVRSGDVPASKLGKQYRFLGTELIRALERGSTHVKQPSLFEG